MKKPKPKKTTNKAFKDPEWYIASAFDLLDLKFASLGKNLSKALKPEVKDTAKELLEMYQLAFNSTLEALSVDQQVAAKKDQEELFFEKILDPDFPSYHPVYRNFVEQANLAVSNPAELGNAPEYAINQHTLRKGFSDSFIGLIQAGSEQHQNAIEYISQLRTLTEPLESKVIAHMNSILEEVEYENLAIDTDLTLRKSYVTPSCVLNDIKLSKMKITPHSNLLQALISTISKSCSPIVIHGQPGHGKTSSVKMLVSALLQSYQDQEVPGSILFYEFKNLRSLNNPVLQVLNSETNFIENEDFFIGRKTVLILDGLDERQIADGSDEILRGFVTSLFHLSKKINKKASTKLNIILTGRSQFVGQIKSSFNSDHFIYEINDFTEEQIKLWLERFDKQKNKTDKISIDQLGKYHLQELISQPILLAISSIMLSDKEGKRLLKELDSQSMNRSLIYKTIIQWSYEKKWQKIPNASSLKDQLTFKEYFVLLQAIAFEVFRFGEETIKLSKLASDLTASVFDLGFIQNNDANQIERLCSQLRISFFFEGVEDKAFSFIHKSIKDFLVVSGIVDVFISLLEDCNIKKLDKEASDLYLIFGERFLSSEDHIPMLDEWVRHKESAIKLHNKKLLPTWERIGLGDLQKSFDTPEQAISKQKNTLHNFYQLISRYFAQLSPEETKQLFGNQKAILFGSTNQPYNLIEFSQFTASIQSSRNLCFSNQLIGSHGSRVKFDFFLCDFSNSSLLDWILFESKFFLCDFDSSVLKPEYMHETEFEACTFYNAKLTSGWSTRLGVANRPSKLLFDNKFFRCDLSEANFLFRDIDFSERGGRKWHLFWNCDLASTTFAGDQAYTIKYNEYYQGTKRVK